MQPIRHAIGAEHGDSQAARTLCRPGMLFVWARPDVSLAICRRSACRYHRRERLQRGWPCAGLRSLRAPLRARCSVPAPADDGLTFG
jgi:hypothetical protein